jgi:hypothetical protein
MRTGASPAARSWTWEAYALYLRARQEIPEGSEESFDLAQQLIDRALARTGPSALLLATAAELGYWYHDQVNTHAWFALAF